MDSSFPIQAVAERTGLTPHVIRAWERRYGAIKPERSPGKHRLYSEAEIERLVILNRAVRSGHSIGKIATLPTADLSALIANHPAPERVEIAPGLEDAGAALRDEAIAAVRHFDSTGLEATLRRALVSLGHQGLLKLAVAPLAQEVGDRWRSGDLTAAHEHFFTAAMKAFLGDVTRQLTTPVHAPRIIVTTPAGQLHELGALMAAATATNLGWRAIYLGANLPSHEIAGAVLRNEATAVALSIVYPEDDPLLPRELTDLAGALPSSVRILAGGRAARGYFETLVRIGALYSESLSEFGSQLDGLRRIGPRTAATGEAVRS